MNSIARVSDARVLPEEEMAIAEAQLREVVGEASTGFFSQYGSFVIFGVAVAIVGAMFLMIYGRHRREKMAGESQSTPLFDEEYVVSEEDDYISADDGFAEVIIEHADEDDDVQDIDYDDGDATLNWEETEAEYSHEDDDVEDSSVVVPLRATEPAEAHEGAEDETEVDEVEEEAPAKRYAFAADAPEKVENNATFARPGFDRDTISRDTTEPAYAPAAEGKYTAGLSTGTDEQSRPFVAPFIREDIERAERRQSDRIEGIRDEFTRQFQTLKNEQSSRLDLVISAIDRKLESLDKRHSSVMPMADTSLEMNRSVSTLGEQVERISSAIEGQGQRIRAITQILETRFAEVGQVRDEVKGVLTEVLSVRSDLGLTVEKVGQVRGDMDEVKEQVGRLERAILDRAAQESSVTVRLADVVRGTLPDGSYAFGATLANGETADCLISFDGLREKIAIDAGFPMEAFHELPSRDAVRRNLPQAKSAEDAFRRAILRAILEAGDRCISPGETTDSCILFLPSEAAYTILHDRFPDLVRDSQRARVWLVSPSTLMGTMHLIRNLLPDEDELEARESRATANQAKREEEERLRSEVTSLRRRASHLAEELERTRGTLRDLISPALKSNDADDDYEEDEEPEIEERSEAEEEMIESLRFEGTPEWSQSTSSPRQREKTREHGVASLFDDDGPETLR